MKILVFGAGGVGSVIGGFLARTGHEVSLLGRPWHLDVIRKEGLLITGIWGDYRMKAFDLYADAQELLKDPPSFDLILLTVKSYDTAEAVKAISRLIQGHTMLLSLQNGLGNRETILEKIPADQVLLGRLIFGVETLPGIAKVTVNAEPVFIGPVPGSEPKLTAERLAMTFNNAKIPTTPVKNILPFIWSKVIYNCALNGLCAYHEIPYGKILEDPGMRGEMEKIVRECYAVGLAQGIALEPGSADEYLEILTAKLIPKTASHFPSMLQDAKKGKRLDIDALNGAIARLGKETGIPTPANQKITQAVKEKKFI